MLLKALMLNSWSGNKFVPQFVYGEKRLKCAINQAFVYIYSPNMIIYVVWLYEGFFCKGLRRVGKNPSLVPLQRLFLSGRMFCMFRMLATHVWYERFLIFVVLKNWFWMKHDLMLLVQFRLCLVLDKLKSWMVLIGPMEITKWLYKRSGEF